MQPRHLRPILTLAASALLSLTARGLEGNATYTPAESNLAGNYWVKGAAKSGTAGAALDGDLGTISTTRSASITASSRRATTRSS